MATLRLATKYVHEVGAHTPEGSKVQQKDKNKNVGAAKLIMSASAHRHRPVVDRRHRGRAEGRCEHDQPSMEGGVDVQLRGILMRMLCSPWLLASATPPRAGSNSSAQPKLTERAHNPHSLSARNHTFIRRLQRNPTRAAVAHYDTTLHGKLNFGTHVSHDPRRRPRRNLYKAALAQPLHPWLQKPQATGVCDRPSLQPLQA